MQEIQELRQASKANNEKQELQNHFNQLQKNLMEKVGSQLETVSTLKSTEEDQLQEKYRLTCFELQKKNQETLVNRERMRELQQKNQELTFNLGKSSEKVAVTEAELNKVNGLLAKYEDSLSQYRKRIEHLQDTLKKANQQLNEQAIQHTSSAKKTSDKIAQLTKQIDNRQK